jgi:hypothetical protein
MLDKLRIPYGEAAVFSEAKTPEVLCAWDVDNDTSPCFGDSGGPVVKNVAGVDRVFGIVSFGMLPDCLTIDQIGIYTRVSYFTSFLGYTMSRELALGSSRLCPGTLAPVVTYTARRDGLTDVKLAWAADSRAERGYRLFYAPQETLGANVSRLELTRGDTQLSVTLASGQNFFVSMQGRSANCDGPLSSLVKVTVP